MFAMTRTRLLVTIICAGAFAALLAFAAFTPAANANHTWSDYHWARTSNPFTVKVGDNLRAATKTPNWGSYLGTASGYLQTDPNQSPHDWQESTMLDDPVGTGDVSTSDLDKKTCTPTGGKVEVCNAEYGQNGWLGVAQIWLSSGTKHITQGTVKMNDTYFNTDRYNTDAWKQMVVCQEVGHTFGLDHQDENHTNTNIGTCMDYTSDPNPGATTLDNRYPNAHDMEELRAIYDPTFKRTATAKRTYGHLDSSTTLSAKAANNLPDEAKPDKAKNHSFNSLREMGQLVSKHGRYELYERKFSDGSRLASWVIRADETTA